MREVFLLRRHPNKTYSEGPVGSTAEGEQRAAAGDVGVWQVSQVYRPTASVVIFTTNAAGWLVSRGARKRFCVRPQWHREDTVKQIDRQAVHAVIVGARVSRTFGRFAVGDG